MNSRCAISLIMSISCCGVAAYAQAGSFDVASIKINKSDGLDSSVSIRGSSFVATNVTLETLLVYAYRPSHAFFTKSQIVGAPQWAEETRFDLQAKLVDSGPIELGEQTNAKLRTLLEERFLLKTHRDVRTLPVYALVPTKTGPQWSDDQSPVEPSRATLRMMPPGVQAESVPRGQLVIMPGAMTTSVIGNAVPIGVLLQLLQPQSERLILDESGIQKLINVSFTFSRDPEGSSSNDAPSVFTALREAGLQLKPEKQAVEVLVIDNASLPSHN